MNVLESIFVSWKQKTGSKAAQLFLIGVLYTHGDACNLFVSWFSKYLKGKFQCNQACVSIIFFTQNKLYPVWSFRLFTPVCESICIEIM